MADLPTAARALLEHAQPLAANRDVCLVPRADLDGLRAALDALGAAATESEKIDTASCFPVDKKASGR